MAISTTVFAPTVKAVQTAFEYDKNNKIGEIEVHFSLSSYNTIEDIKKLKYTIIDPNQKSAFGSNSVFKEGTEKEIEVTDIQKNNESSEDLSYYFIIPFSDLKELSVNQYYQVQIYLQDSLGNYSAPSQATLIRPIPKIQEFIINGLKENTLKELKAKDLKELKGYLSYVDESTKEYLAEYIIDIFDNENNKVYSTNWVYNVDGLNFSQKIAYNFAEGYEYQIIFLGETLNGYIFEKKYQVKILSYSTVDDWEDFELINNEIIHEKGICNDSNSGAIKISVKFNLFNGDMIVQRSQMDDNFNTWIDVLKLSISDVDSEKRNGFAIYDYLVNGDSTVYKYRFLKVIDDKVEAISTEDIYMIESMYDDIFLSNKEKQLGIKYNPNISGFKWVTQESITNSLGGKYPLIRRSGDTKYRQFNLSGTLYFDPLILSATALDSQGIYLEQFFPNEESSLFLSVNEILKGNWTRATWNSRTTESKISIYEKRFKDAAMDFLTDGKPKLFRSPTEGLILVILTNISFTPNKQLGRRMVDFSATATEFAEVTQENLIRYGITSEIEYTYYALEVIKTVSGENQNYFITPYVSEYQVIENEGSDKEVFLKLVEKKVRTK